MTPTDWIQLLDLLQRKWQAKSQDTSTVQPGDTISLSLTALDEARLKELRDLAIAEKSVLEMLVEQAKVIFFKAIEKDRDDLLARGEDEAHSLIYEEFCIAVDHVLDEQQNGFTQILLLICIEHPDLFTAELLQSAACIIDPDEHGLHREYGKVSAMHIVYHNLYDLLKSRLEFDFCLWHQEQRRDE